MSIAEGGAVFMEKFGIRTTQCGACPSSASVHPCSTLVLSHCAGATKLGSSTTKVSKQAMVVLTNATKAAAFSLPDADSDGRISHAEVKHAGAVLAALDTNQDGKVSTSEVKQAVTAAAATAATSVTAATAADEPDANHEDTAAAAASEGSSVKDASTGAASVELAQVPAADRIAPRGCLNGCVGSSGPARVTERGPPPENEWAGPDHKSEGEQTSSARASHEGGLDGGVDMNIDGRSIELYSSEYFSAPRSTEHKGDMDARILYAHRLNPGSYIAHHHRSHYIRRSTACCLAGEARSLVVARMRQALLRNLVKPLLADVFLALSSLGLEDPSGGLDDNIRAIEEQLQPLSTVVSRDDQTVEVLWRLSNMSEHSLLRHDMPSIMECTRMQPLLRRSKLNGLDELSDEYYAIYYQTGACSPQLSLALRFRACLELIQSAERASAIAHQYTWVVRARPDIALPCALPSMGAGVFDANTVRYVLDFAAFLPRRAAKDALRQVPLAFQLNASKCFDAGMRGMFFSLPAAERPSWKPWHHTLEMCNPCVSMLGGWRTEVLWAKVWSAEQRAYLQQSVAYPVRHSRDPPRLPNFLPFGDSPNTDNPEVPVGGRLYPECTLTALDQQHDAVALHNESGESSPLLFATLGIDWSPDEVIICKKDNKAP